MERAAEGKFAYISWKIYQQDIIARNFIDSAGVSRVYQVRGVCVCVCVCLFVCVCVCVCDVCPQTDRSTTQAKGVFNTPSNLAWAFPPASDLRTKFDKIILRLQEVRAAQSIVTVHHHDREAS